MGISKEKSGVIMRLIDAHCQGLNRVIETVRGFGLPLRWSQTASDLLEGRLTHEEKAKLEEESAAAGMPQTVIFEGDKSSGEASDDLPLAT